MRQGNANDPFHLPDGLEAVISYDSNGKNGAIPLSLMLTMYTIHARCDKASEWVGGSFTVRNSFASYGASAVTRTSDRGHVAEASTPWYLVKPRSSEANVKWFSVASPGPAGNFTENAVSPLRLRARAQLGWIPNV